MTGNQIIFILIALVTLASSVMVVGSRKMVHAALWLILTLMGVAGIFALLEIRFFAVVQVLVYIGAIATLIVVAVMLTRNVMEDVGPQVIRGWWMPAAAALILYAGMTWALSKWSQFNLVQRTVGAGGENVADLGKALVDPARFVIPFEVASILLLAALVGAIFLASERKEERL